MSIHPPSDPLTAEDFSSISAAADPRGSADEFSRSDGAEQPETLQGLRDGTGFLLDGDRGAQDEVFRQLAQNIREVFYVRTDTKHLIYVSPAYEHVWGRSRSLLLRDPLDWLKGVHPEDQERVERWAAEECDSERELEYRVLRPDGELRWIRDRCFPVRNAGGQAYRIVGIAEDATEHRRRTERQRFLAEAGPILALPLTFAKRLDLLARLSVPGLADYCVVDVVDERGAVSRVASAHANCTMTAVMEEIRQYPPRPEAGEGVAEVLRTGLPKVVHNLSPDDLERFAQGPRHLELIRQLCPRSLLIIPLAARGHTLGAISFVLSESRRHFDEEDLSTAKDLGRFASVILDNIRLYEEAQRTARAREEILTVVSHELRQPLHALGLMTDTFLKEVVNAGTASQRSLLDSVRRLIDQSARLVDDLLDVSQIEAGRLTVRPEPLNVQTVIREIVEEFDPRWEAGVTLRIVSEDRLPAVVADKARLAQVLRNLLRNAEHVTPKGGTVALGLSSVGGTVLFSVADDGPGVDPDDVPHLFQRFWKGGGGGPRGAGLGLAICKGIVEAHGGRIWIESHRPTGSRFCFTLPAGEFQHSTNGAGHLADSLPEPPPTELGSCDVRPPFKTPSQQKEGHARVGAFLREMGALCVERPRLLHNFAQLLENRTLSAMYAGRLLPGDKLPSIREMSRTTGAAKRQVESAYQGLQADGITHPRERSGVFLRDLSHKIEEAPTETASWLAEVLTGACEHQIRIPYLPELLRRWTVSERLHCACIESDHDSRATLCAEVERNFGPRAVGIDAEGLPASGGSANELHPALAAADLWVTTPIHVPRVGRLADALEKPVVVASIHPRTVRAVEEHLHRSDLTVVCTDHRFGARMRALFGSGKRSRIHVVLADDEQGLDSVSREEPVLMTWAAREKLGSSGLRLVSPILPAYDPNFVRSMSHLLLKLNLEGGR